jgi:hypothetical protein
MLKPMPSPSGSNIEKLFILRGRGASSNPQGAYDSAYNSGPRTAAEGARYGAQFAKRMTGGARMAYDEGAPDPLAGAGAGVGSSDAVNTIVQWATQNLGEQEIEELVAALGNRNMSLDAHRRHAMDAQRRPQRGMSASASKSFHEMFPDAARIRTM